MRAATAFGMICALRQSTVTVHAPLTHSWRNGTECGEIVVLSFVNKRGGTAVSTDGTRQNPTQQGPQPPFPHQKQEPPGLESQMQPRPDYGEESYQGSGRLQGYGTIITGADSGIGRAVALAFAREGADVLISYLSEDSDAQETARVVQRAGRKAVLVRGDVGREEHCRQIVQRALQEFGRLDVLVNNAAFQMTHESIDELSSEEFDYTFRTNIYATFFLSKAALPHLREGGSIINTASIEAYEPNPMLLAYSATKGAIVTFTKALAKEAIKKGIRVNAVAPGPIWTPLIPSTMPEQKVEQFGKTTPTQRPGQPAELAPVYVFLASHDASYITGEVIGVTGGRLLP
jgi:NAD(P)-dependent dehydrogenase (short-subunit alcohol dehydrogenase family)